MPTYEYVCEKCGHRFDIFQKMSDAKLTACPLEGCDGTVRRLLGTGAGVIFKGGGFYQTDYRSESYKSGQKKESEAGKPKEEKGEGAKKGDGKGKTAEGGGSGKSGEGAPKKAD